MSKTTILLIAEHTPAEGQPYTVEVRNDQKQVVSFTQYTADGQLDQVVENDYDSEGRLKEQRQFFQETLAQRVLHHYSDAGQLESETIIFMDGSKSIRSFERNEADQSVLSRLVDEDGEEEEKLYRRMDSEGRVVEEKLESEGELQHHVRSSFDDSGRLLERHTTDSEGHQDSIIVHYELDDQGRVTTAKITNAEGELLRVEALTFDDRGNRTELRFQDHQQGYAAAEQWSYNLDNKVTEHTRLAANGQATSRTQYSYDEAGRLLEEEQQSAQGTQVLRYVYE